MEVTFRNDQARLKAECLLRDGGCCVLSGFPDRNIDVLNGGPTERAHIIPLGLGEVSSEMVAAACCQGLPIGVSMYLMEAQLSMHI